MLSAIPSEAISRNAVQVSKEGASATDFIGKRAETSDHPLAFLVNGPPAFVIPAHFHEIDQYQIFVGGSATWASTRSCRAPSIMPMPTHPMARSPRPRTGSTI
jgi:hypothetical protein